MPHLSGLQREFKDKGVTIVKSGKTEYPGHTHQVCPVDKKGA
jgi:hypothetical protein